MSMQTVTLEDLGEALAAATPDYDRRRARIALGLLRLLAEGEPVSAGRVAEAVDEREEAVSSDLDDMAGVFRRDDGLVIGFFGLAIPEMAHRLEVGGRTLHGWCAWDTLFLPELIGAPARVISECPVTGEEIRLTVGAGGVTETTHEDAVVSFLVPGERFDATVMQTFCHHVHFFASREAGERWAAGRDAIVLTTVAEAYELGRRVNRATFGAAL